MRKNFGAKPITYPQPVFIIASYDENGKPDAMNAAWGGICCSCCRVRLRWNSIRKQGAGQARKGGIPHCKG